MLLNVYINSSFSSIQTTVKRSLLTLPTKHYVCVLTLLLYTRINTIALIYRIHFQVHRRFICMSRLFIKRIFHKCNLDIASRLHYERHTIILLLLYEQEQLSEHCVDIKRTKFLLSHSFYQTYVGLFLLITIL